MNPALPGSLTVSADHSEARKRLARRLYRIAAVLFVLFAAGHTFGFLTLKPPTPESQAVLDGMKSVHFTISGSTFSYGEFYTGFGLSITAYMLFSAFLAWHLSGLAGSRQAVGGLGWAFFALQIANLALSLIYFAGAPVLFSAAVVLCLGSAAWVI